MGIKSSDIDVSTVAALARLELSVEEKADFTEQFGKVLGYFDTLKKVTDYLTSPRGLRGASKLQVTKGKQPQAVLREDEERKGLTRDEVLQNAPAAENGYIKVRAVFGENSERSAKGGESKDGK